MKFSDILGNAQAIDRVRHLIDTDRLPHAILLYGQPGIPKLALARTMAQYLHCTNRHDGEPCGECPSCRQHMSMNCTDLFFSFPYLRKEKEKLLVCDDYIDSWNDFITDCPIVEDYQHWLELLKNDNAQPIIYDDESENIIHKMNLTSMARRYKVLIMWLPEKMNQACANKLLKLIEEPYDDCKFILVSDNAQDILTTIYSRTQRIELKRLSTELVASYLTRKYDLDPQDALAIAAPHDGNVIEAERAMKEDNENTEFHNKFMELMRLAYSRNLAKLKVWSEAIADMKREKSRRFLAYCSRQVRENFIYNLHSPQLNYLTRDEEKFSSKFSPFINEQNVERMFGNFERAEREIQGNGNAKIILFDLAVQITILIKV